MISFLYGEYVLIQVALFDVDGTLVADRVWKGIINHPSVSQWRVRQLYARTMPRLAWLQVNPGYQTGFRDRWVRGLAQLLKGWTVEQVDEMAYWAAEIYLRPVYRDDVIRRLQDHKMRGNDVILVSTMFPAVLGKIASRIGADAWLGTEYAIDDGILTGEIVGESCVGPRKLDFVREYLSRSGTGSTLANCVAYADSFSDVPLLTAAEQACAVYPDDKLLAVARERGWEIYPQ